jgi:hypothetical protein
MNIIKNSLIFISALCVGLIVTYGLMIAAVKAAGF